MNGDRHPIRLAELVAALSLGIDLGFGQPMEHVLRQCLIALRLADLVGLDDEDRAAAYYAALLVQVGCHTDAHEQARWMGDDIALKSKKYDPEMSAFRQVTEMLKMVGAGSPPLHRIRTGFAFAVSGRKEFDAMIAQHARLARVLGEQLDLSAPTLVALGGSYERWDGKGWPGALAGEAIPMPARIVQLAEFVEVAHRAGGIEAARSMAESRSGTQFDPNLVSLFSAEADKVLDGLDSVGSWDAVIDGEPSLAIVLTEDECDAALVAIATFVDLKSPYTLGHSRAVAELAATAGARLGVSTDEVRTIYRAGLVHDFGRLGVSNAIWDKKGPLGAGEWERVRMYPYYGERMLQQSETLASVAKVVVQHRERLDASGYPRGLPGSAISRPARVVGAADAYQAMREPRPHRPALSADAAARELREEVHAGRLDADAVDAVLTAAGHRVVRRREGPAGLTTREVEVLRLLARGLSNREIAAQLVITPKTAGNHIEHIYTKIGATNRTSASLFAMQHGLLPEEGFATLP